MEFLAKIELLYSILQWLRSQLTPVKFDETTLRKIELASEEALVNIIRYAYPDLPGTIAIDVHLFPNHVEIAIADHGPPFNPLHCKKPNLSKNLEERAIGGLGIHLMRQCVDEVIYKRDRNRNILTLIKKYPLTHSSQKK